MVQIGGARDTNLGLKVEHFQTLTLCREQSERLMVQIGEARVTNLGLKMLHFQTYDLFN